MGKREERLQVPGGASQINWLGVHVEHGVTTPFTVTRPYCCVPNAIK
jgi:hypothetical protein